MGTTDERQSDVQMPGRPNNSEPGKPVFQTGFTQSLEQGYRIFGRVARDDSDEPVPEAKLAVTWENRGSFQRADKTGHFDFTSLAAGKYDVDAIGAEPGYLNARMLVEFPEGVTEREITVKLPRGEAVCGSVLDADTGGGVPDVDVRYVPADQPKGDNWSPASGAKAGSPRYGKW